eukprot:2266478-Alexandrium_andersonii.AAC.1
MGSQPHRAGEQLAGAEQQVRELADECQLDAVPRLRGLVGEHQQDAARRLRERLHEPVSYTHLTLPTICSV